MKMIIDISDKVYEAVKNRLCTANNRNDALDAIANGTPIPIGYTIGLAGGFARLDDIKAEINQTQYNFMADKDYDEGIRFGLMLAYQIIDRKVGE